MQRSFESFNFPSRFARHRNFRLVLDYDDNTAQFNADSSFFMRNGLANSALTSLESANFPGHFLRHRNFEVWLEKDDGSAQFKEDATFHRRSGLQDNDFVSFESTNYPGRFIRHRRFEFFLEPSDGTDLFRKDATFRIRNAGNAAAVLSTETITAISHLRATASWENTSPGSASATAVYNPPPGWVVVSTQTIIHSSSNGSREVSVLAAGLELVTFTDINGAYDAAIDYAQKQGDQSLWMKLEEKKKEHVRELRRYSTNCNTVQATVRAKAHGSMADRKRGWEEISVLADIMKLGAPGVDDVVSSLESEYGFDIPGI